MLLLGQMWYVIVLIPDLCLLAYFYNTQIDCNVSITIGACGYVASNGVFPKTFNNKTQDSCNIKVPVNSDN